MWNWKVYYTKVIDEVRKGTWKAGAVWPGMAEGIVDLAPFGPMVPKELQDKVNAEKARIIAGEQKIFVGPIKDQSGAVKVARDFPKVKFLHCSGYKNSETMANYFGRIYQARYLTGMVAGAMTKSKVLGYVAAFPIPEVIRGINAFTLGAQAVNPDVQVRVVWTKTWYDPATEKEAAKSLLDVGCDVIAQHQDSPGPQEAAQERGVYSIGYNSDMSAFAPKSHLTSAVWNWGPFYTEMIEQIKAGTWKSQFYWPGLDKGVVDIAPFASMVPEDVRKTVLAKKADIASGAYKVFTGPIKDQTGAEKVPAGAVMADADLLGFNWFVQGVVGTLE